MTRAALPPRERYLVLALGWLLVVPACGGDPPGTPPPDGQVASDAAAPDASVDATWDAASPPTDSGADAAPDAAPCEDPPAVVGDPLAALGQCGRLVYGPYANRDQSHADNRLPDFSHAGYRRGGVALPSVPVVETVNPQTGDDGARIQAAIDAVSALPPAANGFRGAVLLTAGTYQVDAPLRIEASGVVLRGEGQGTGGTRIRATAPVQYTLIEVAGGAAPAPVSGTRTRITDAYVPVGATSFTVEDAAGLAPGDSVGVVRTPNDAWIQVLGLEAFWTASGYEILHEREVVAVDGVTGLVTVDIPIVDSLAEEHGGGRLVRLDAGARIRRVGIEDLRLDSDFASDTDNDHGWTAILLSGVEDAWVRRVTALHFGKEAVQVANGSRFITVEDSAMLDPKSTIAGGNRYPFHVTGGLGVLFQRLYVRGGRHNFVTGSRVTGPHVWLDCRADENHADDGPHHRWATGLLFDNTRSEQLRVQNRYDSGSGHGWAGAQVLFWNGRVTDHYVCDAPPGAMSWAVGMLGDLGEGQWIAAEPPGIIESPGTPVEPRSLYLQQLQDRLGPDAVLQISTAGQRAGRIWADLAAWAGEGPPPW